MLVNWHEESEIINCLDQAPYLLITKCADCIVGSIFVDLVDFVARFMQEVIINLSFNFAAAINALSITVLND